MRGTWQDEGITETASSPASPESEAVLRWARQEGLVAGAGEERRLAAMRLEVLAGRALPGGGAADVALTAQWMAFICWVDDRIDRHGLGSVPGELEPFIGPLREVLAAYAQEPLVTAPHALVLARLWERTVEGTPQEWRSRFTADYLDFLDATEQEVSLRRAGVRLALADYVQLRRRTITLVPMLDVLERTGHAPLVHDSEVVRVALRDLRWAVADVAGWANDLASQANDTAAGQDNLVSILARCERCEAAAARGRVAAMIEERRAGFHGSAHALRRDAAMHHDRNRDLVRYVDLVENFMAAVLYWLACTGRFTHDPESPAPTAGGRATSLPGRG